MFKFIANPSVIDRRFGNRPDFENIASRSRHSHDLADQITFLWSLHSNLEPGCCKGGGRFPTKNRWLLLHRECAMG